MRASLLLAVSAVSVVASVVLAACSAEGPAEGAPSGSERLGHAASPIINGQLDTTHQAVVAIALQQGQQGGLCSGTIVKVDTSTNIGWVLTAAHCVDIPPVSVLQGNDFAQPTGVLRYDVIDYKADPRWTGQTGSPYDIAVIRIAGVDASTPSIPITASPDGLSVGTSVVSVGYGRTSLIAAGAGDENTVRRRVSKTLSNVGQTIAFDMRTNGICQGDSGGPVLVSSGGAERVVGVHSYVQGDCNGVGVSGRVTFNAAFVNAELARAAPTRDCALCEKIVNSGNSTCAAATQSCLADKECRGYYECLSSGQTRPACIAKFPKAEGPFNAAANCTCTTACVTECKDSLQCRQTPRCGYKLPAGDCATCTEGSCCDASLACAADGECYVCLKTNDAAPECATNVARKAMATCVASKCNTQCAGTGLDTGAEPVPEEPTPAEGSGQAPVGKTTVTTSGCAASPGLVFGRSSYGVLGLASAVALLFRRRRRRG